MFCFFHSEWGIQHTESPPHNNALLGGILLWAKNKQWVLLEDMQNMTIKGLAHEYKNLSEELSIPNVVFNRVKKSF